MTFVPLFTLAAGLLMLYIARARAGQTKNAGVVRGAALVAVVASLAALALSAVRAARFGIF